MSAVVAEQPTGAEASEPLSEVGERTAFWLHAVAWFLFYLTVVIAWGQRNSWPSALLLCVFSLPMTTLVASTIFKVREFTFAIEPARSQQEQLIAALILAVGLASGQLLLMALGLLCLGIAWMRPAQPGVDWAEWFKIPVIYLTALPFWLDFEGSRIALAGLFDDPIANPVFNLPLALSTTQAHVLGYCSIMGMALFLHGRAFWIALPALPLFLIGVCLLPRLIPGWVTLPSLARAAAPWLLACLLLALISRTARRLEDASRSIFTGQTLKRWFEGRRYPPWLALLVVSIMQALPLETVRFASQELIAIAGLALVMGLLLGLRSRTPRGPIHSRSVAMVAGGLALTLLAEFATTDQLRHMSLALALIGLLSWHCFWPLRIFAVSSLACTLLLVAPERSATGPLGPDAILAIRTIGAFGLLITLAWMIQRPLPLPGSHGYADHGWIPPKRFALILLTLMMLFQTAAAFWPDHEMGLPDQPSVSQADNEPADLLTSGQTGWLRVPSPKGPVQITIAFPRKNPYLLESPERTLQRHGWTVLERVRAAHPQGEATVLKLERDGARATAMWWFELGDRAFANHLYARRVLWSGWHLADRRLRLIRLESTAIHESSELIAIAQREGWFRNSQGKGSTRIR
ncbi:MAG: hypothetical protein JNK85_06155 [Verrucomicrobiales bacterium]|nr:hypothetical protein [Verrucomicrobiales bacterium]